MKRLLLLRHAKASPSHGEPDHDRELAPRGIADAQHVARSIAAAGWRPDVILVSDSRRTRQTCDAVRALLRPEPPVRFEHRLYEASPGAVMDIVASAPSESACVLVIGHNPGLAAAAQRAARDGEAGELKRLGSRFPTSALAVLRFEVATWAGIIHAQGKLEALLWVDRSGQAD